MFLKGNSTGAIDVVNSFAELYRVGTFVQIPERDDVGTKIGMPVMGHHMIQIVKAVPGIASDANVDPRGELRSSAFPQWANMQHVVHHTFNHRDPTGGMVTVAWRRSASLLPHRYRQEAKNSSQKASAGNGSYLKSCFVL
ncbi:Lon protease homolog, mitochondrial [Echinococcus multilocularis]|uniref:Lon protease homolog, mitochondrial n=1 Tax=Echinococcus multilocularis TaxID=6211 RepID=A0A0S4MK83_ECHMU|nr:Lon protease homolog, mitochondrial [Echinococcus multilocularis]